MREVGQAGAGRAYVWHDVEERYPKARVSVRQILFVEDSESYYQRADKYRYEQKLNFRIANKYLEIETSISPH